MIKRITALIINYRTLELTARCVESLLGAYEQIHVLLVDNGSQDASSEYIRSLAARYQNITAIFNHQNRFHGPAMDQGIRASRTNLVFTLDSDSEVKTSGFLEEMTALFAEPQSYAIGKLVYMNRFGYEIPPWKGRRFPYIHPRHMLLDREKYLRLKPFTHHGSPCLVNMRQAVKRGYQLLDYPIDAYIEHRGRGTSSSFGYGFGIRYKIDFCLNRALYALSKR